VKLLALPFTRRYALYALALLATLVFLVLTVAVAGDFWPALIVAFALSLLGTYDLFQVRHSILRSYPIVAHLRFLFEDMRPEIRQYFLESDTDGVPFDRNTRSIVYQRAKGELESGRWEPNSTSMPPASNGSITRCRPGISKPSLSGSRSAAPIAGSLIPHRF